MIFLNESMDACVVRRELVLIWCSIYRFFHAVNVVFFNPDSVDNAAQSIRHKAHVFVCVQADGRKWLQISIFLHLSLECSD